MTLTIRIELSPDAHERLMRPIAGQGGFQSLLRSLQGATSTGGVLILTPDDVQRIARYVHSYGGGGFQGRLDAVLKELTLLARALEPMAA
jgi:hypothetical protein